METFLQSLLAAAAVLSTASPCLASVGGTRRVFPRAQTRLALYDERLSNSLHVEVQHNLVLGSVRSQATLTFESPLGCVQGEMLNYTVSLWSAEASQPKLIGPYPVESCLEPMKITLTGLVRDASYSLGLTAYNNRTRLKSKTIQFLTSDIQRAVLAEGEKSFKVYCSFAKGSTAKGCQLEVSLFDSYTSALLERRSSFIPAEGGMGCFELHPFTVPRGMVVRDWKQDGSVGRVGLAPKHVNGSPNLSCKVGVRKQFAAKARVALFYMSGVSFVAGVSAILVGMACKLGRLHSHFRKSESYKVLQGEKARS